MLKRIGLKALGVFLFFCGAGLIELAFREPGFDPGGRIFGGICGLILLVSGVVFVVMRMEDALDLRGGSPRDEEYWNGSRFAGLGKGKASKLLRELRSEVSPNFLIASVDHNDTEKLIRSFRRDYAAFFDHSGISENDPIQNETTQIYWHTLYLQKRRMDRKRVLSRMESERLHYGDLNPVQENTVSDGKYQITDVSETVEAIQTFESEQGKTIYKKVSLQTAWYRILQAARAGDGLVVCPNCGNEATRENLIDGCDYCGTKFTVEDLGARISEFAFRPDYEAEYARYTDVRKTYAKRVGLIVGLPILFLCLFSALSAATWDESSYTLTVAAVMFAAAFPAFAAVLLAEVLFFIFLFPLLQAKASVSYFRKRSLARMKEQQDRNAVAEQEVRRYDPLFSLNGFYSNIQNKLSVIHFADTVREAAAFTDSAQAEKQIAAFLPEYQDLISMETEELELTDYQVNRDLQEATVTARLRLLSEKNGAIKATGETVRLRLVKSAACRTQSIYEPSFVRCGSCGAPFSMMDGRFCLYCGQSRRLRNYDWAIREYTKESK